MESSDNGSSTPPDHLPLRELESHACWQSPPPSPDLHGCGLPTATSTFHGRHGTPRTTDVRPPLGHCTACCPFRTRSKKSAEVPPGANLLFWLIFILFVYSVDWTLFLGSI